MLPSLTRRGDHAQLLQHSELVEGAPRLDDLSMLNAVDAHADDRRRLAGRWHASQFARIRSTAAPSCHDGIAFGDLLHRDGHFGPFRPGGHPRQRVRAAADGVRGQDLVEHGQIPLLKSLLEEAADDRFVGFS
jgi:hypothetical protein